MKLRDAQNRDRDLITSAIRQKVEDHGLSYHEAAWLLGLPVTSVQRRAQRAGVRSQHQSLNPRHRKTAP